MFVKAMYSSIEFRVALGTPLPFRNQTSTQIILSHEVSSLVDVNGIITPSSPVFVCLTHLLPNLFHGGIGGHFALYW